MKRTITLTLILFQLIGCIKQSAITKTLQLKIETPVEQNNTQPLDFIDNLSDTHFLLLTSHQV